MGKFFKIPADNNLLHASVRTNAELENIVNKVEWEIIDAFSQRYDRLSIRERYSDFFEFEAGSNPNQEIKVRLAGYNESDPEASDAGLLEALKRTVADVVSDVLMDYNNERGVQSQRQGNRSISYSGSVPTWRDWKSGWDLKLDNYDVRVKLFAT